MRSPSNCKIQQTHLCQSLVDRLLRSAFRWPRLARVDYAQRINIIALGALARLPKALTDGVLSDDFDGDQIYTILSEVLFNSWVEVPGALTWATYDPTTQWQDAENSGLGDIDRPGNYELENRSSDRIDVYSLVSALATSGSATLVRKCTRPHFLCRFSTHRTVYLAANGYVELTANHALASGLSIQSSHRRCA
jgi:hypothetical protein